MEIDSENTLGDSSLNDRPSSGPQHAENKLVRLLKTIEFNPDEPNAIDENVVSSRYYNCFNYTLLPKHPTSMNFTIGVTSPNPGDGKTLVASNLAVSLALGYQRETILVDFNIKQPRVHKVFGTPLKPGLTEAFSNGSIHVSKTQIKHLHVLSSGRHVLSPMGRVLTESADAPRRLDDTHLGPEHMAAFRDIIYSLQQEFEFIIVDMPSIDLRNFPIISANQLDGILLVLHAGKTKRQEIDRVFRDVNEHLILGFVLNFFNEKTI